MSLLRDFINWIQKKMPYEQNSPIDLEEEKVRQRLGWLVDVPLFIDETRVSQLYDVTVEPVFEEYRRDATEEAIEESSKSTNEVEGGVEAGIGTNSVLGMIGEGKLSAHLRGRYARQEEEREEIRYKLTQTPQRQLAQIAIEYYFEDLRSSSNADNYHYVSDPGKEIGDSDHGWWKPSDRFDPRNLVVLPLHGIEDDLSDKSRVPTQLVPTAAEFEDGAIVELYQMFEDDYEKPPRYPYREDEWDEMGEYYRHIDEEEFDELEDTEGRVGEKIGEARRYYWKWFENKFTGKRATKIVEKAGEEHGDIRWIDFRLPLNQDGDTLHLHIQGRGEYNTGTFAYNLIKRGYKHGITLVGTVKSEPDMDVLAIYER